MTTGNQESKTKRRGFMWLLPILFIVFFLGVDGDTETEVATRQPNAQTQLPELASSDQESAETEQDSATPGTLAFGVPSENSTDNGLAPVFPGLASPLDPVSSLTPAGTVSTSVGVTTTTTAGNPYTLITVGSTSTTASGNSSGTTSTTSTGASSSTTTTTNSSTTSTTAATTSTTTAAPPNTVPIPSYGAYIGMNTGDSTNGVTVALRESQLGHQMAIERIFYGNSTWSLSNINIDMAVTAHNQGRIPMVSYKVGAWKQVTDGSSDAIIDKLAGQIKDSGIPMLLTFHHEPEDNACYNSNPSCGEGQTAADFVAMWQYIHDRFDTHGVNNVSWNWVIMGWQWESWASASDLAHVKSMYPGSSYVDWISSDPYNRAGNCSLTPSQISNRWTDLDDLGIGWYNWASQFGKPLAFAEWGTFNDSLNPGRKASWFDDATDIIKSWPNVKAVVYFDRNHEGCDWRLDTGGSTEMAGYQDLIDDPYFIKG